MSDDKVLRELQLIPVPHTAARNLVEHNHYLGSMPGGTKICLGVFLGVRLLGVMTLGAGPPQGHALVEGARSEDCLTLTRLWLDGELPRNSESKVIGLALRSLVKNTSVKFVLSYADPDQGHVGTIYQASNWTYTGLSSATPSYNLGDGRLRHSRSIGHMFGTHSVKRFRSQGVPIEAVAGTAKHRYIYFLDRTWRRRLNVEILPYPKSED